MARREAAPNPYLAASETGDHGRDGEEDSRPSELHQRHESIDREADRRRREGGKGKLGGARVAVRKAGGGRQQLSHSPHDVSTLITVWPMAASVLVLILVVVVLMASLVSRMRRVALVVPKPAVGAVLGQ
jgi:hypothetical protein